MPVDKFTQSVTQNVDTNAAAARPWRNMGSVIHRIQVAAPSAATNATWTLQDASDVPFNKQSTSGTAISYEANAFLDVNMQADREWQLILYHTGASAQTFDIIVEWN